MSWKPLVLLLTLAALAGAQEPAAKPLAPAVEAVAEDEFSDLPAPGWVVTAECRMVLVSQALALSVIPKFTSMDKAAEAWNEVEKATSRDEAKLVTALLVQSTDGKRGVGETIEEMRYPTEYDPPQLPEKIPDQNAADVLKLWPAVSITPTAFETRNIGQTVELDPTVNTDGSLIRCRAVAQHVRFLRWATYDSGKLANGEKLSVDQPIFHVMKTSTDVTVVNGQTLLIGIHKAPAPEEGYELFLMRVRAERRTAK